MNLLTWIRDRLAMDGVDSTDVTTVLPVVHPHGDPHERWEEVPAYVPVDPASVPHVCVIASAIAAGDHPESQLVLRRVLVPNPEHRRLSVIASAIAAGDRGESSLVVRHVYRKLPA